VKPPPPEDKPKGQVVDVAPSDDSRAPDKARFLSDRDNRVEKETRSRWAGTEVFKNRAPAPVHGDQQGEQRPKAVGEGGKDRETRQAKAGQGGANGSAAKEAPRKEETARKPSPDERLALLEPPQKPGLLEPRPPAPGDKSPAPGEEGLANPGAPGEQQDGQKKLGDPRLLPSVPSMSRITAGPSSDYIDRDVEEGDATALNTKGFKFATFWNRFKQDVVGHWRPAIVYNERDPDGSLFGSRAERATTLHVVLDANGSLKDIKVVEPSGLDFLDREAVRAVRAASPFYNVPTGLLDEKGEVTFSFGMVLVMDRPVPVRPRYQPGSP
jgi:TonB family protein